MSDSVNFGAEPVRKDDSAGSAPKTIKDLIRESVAARTKQTIKVTHPDVPEWDVTYRVPVDRSEVTRIMERTEAKAKREKSASEFDAVLLAQLCESIEFQGVLLTDDRGGNLTFMSEEFQGLVDATTYVTAVRNMYGSDGYVSAVCARLLEEAGYGTSEDVFADPS